MTVIIVTSIFYWFWPFLEYFFLNFITSVVKILNYSVYLSIYIFNLQNILIRQTPSVQSEGMCYKWCLELSREQVFILRIYGTTETFLFSFFSPADKKQGSIFFILSFNQPSKNSCLWSTPPTSSTILVCNPEWKNVPRLLLDHFLLGLS